jgi:hypothetical protein
MKKLILTVALIFNAVFAQASTCSGVPVQISIDLKSGDLFIGGTFGGMNWPRLCNLRGTSPNGIPVESCRALHATLISAKAMNKAVSLGTTGTQACNAFPGWGWVDGLYFLNMIE